MLKINKRRLIQRLAATTAILCLMLLYSLTISAATFTVTNLNDAGIGSLRQAILEANTTPGTDAIIFQAALTGTITLTTGQLSIMEGVNITGAGVGNLIVSGNNASRVMEITGLGTTILSNLTVTGGRDSGNGGGIRNAGVLVMTNVIISGNSAGTNGGGISNAGNSTITITDSIITNNSTLGGNPSLDGGGVANFIGGTMNISNSTIGNNTSARLGGAIANFGTMTLTGSTINGNTAPNGFGGGILNAGTASSLNINNSTVNGNSAQNAGGVVNSSTALLNIMNSAVTNNISQFQSGGIDNQGSTLTIINSTFSGNVASTIGGGISNFAFSGQTAMLTLINCTIAANRAQNGGGIATGNNPGAVNSTTRLINTLTADNAGGNFLAGGESSFLVSNGNNLDNDSSSGFTDGVNGDIVFEQLSIPIQIGLSSLGSNGGTTQTHALLIKSLAKNKGNNCVITATCLSANSPVPLTTDQRGVGFARLKGTTVDIGAFEAAENATSFDFDGDNKADISVFRPATGTWFFLNSRSGSLSGVGFGLSTDALAPADYDGDGKTDIAVFRTSSTVPARTDYFILQSTNNAFRQVQFGAAGDIPLSADFDGDGISDLALYRKGANNSQSFFFYRPSFQIHTAPINFISIQFGLGDDKPVAADFDGDGVSDIAVFRPSNGVWFIRGSRDGFFAVQFGAAEDKPVVGDYDGDGRADQAVYRPSIGVWFLNRSTAGFGAAQFGIAEDRPTAADYDGDGKADIAVYRPSLGVWYVLSSQSGGFFGVGFGTGDDKPIENAFVP